MGPLLVCLSPGDEPFHTRGPSPGPTEDTHNDAQVHELRLKSVTRLRGESAWRLSKRKNSRLAREFK